MTENRPPATTETSEPAPPSKPITPKQPRGNRTEPAPNSGPSLLAGEPDTSGLQKREFKFEAESVPYTIMIPPGSELEINSGSISVVGPGNLYLEIICAKLDFNDNFALRFPEDESRVLEKTPTFKLLESYGEMTFGLNRTIGYRDFYAMPTLIVGAKPFSRADCAKMVNIARTLELAKPLPEDPIAVLKLYGVELEGPAKKPVAAKSFYHTTPATMTLLTKIPSLESLLLDTSVLGDTTFDALAQMPKLSTVFMDRYAPTDEYLPELKKLPHLTALQINLEEPESMPKLGELKNLEVLQLGGAGITDESLAHLAALSKLKALDLSSSYNVKGTGLAKLSGLKDLTRLNLQECEEINDGAVDAICQLKSLKNLNILFTSISPQGGKKIRAALKGCTVEGGVDGL